VAAEPAHPGWRVVGGNGSSAEVGRWILDEASVEAWGREIGSHAELPVVIALRGDLGAGKSTLARAIARGAGVGGHIPSPTYNLLLRYAGRGDRGVVHVDLYRLEDPSEVRALGWSELPGEREIVLIEWPGRAEAELPRSRWEVAMEEVPDPERRSITVSRFGSPAWIPLPERST
jgi:tRNA threonylcarbamoyladenosine biosynthesis protein TsaE